MINTFFKCCAMYTEIDYFKIAKVPIMLGDTILKPGMLVSRIGEDEGTSFEMLSDCYLEYIGKCKENDNTLILFSLYPREEGFKKVDTYYSFYYTDKNTLSMRRKSYSRYIKVNEIKTFNKSELLGLKPISFEDALKKKIAKRGSHFSGGVERIKKIVNSSLDKSEKIRKLKDEYGLGGGGTFCEMIFGFEGWEEHSPVSGVKIKDWKWDVILSLNWKQLYEIMEEEYLEKSIK